MCDQEFIALRRKVKLIKEFKKLSGCYSKLVTAFEEAYALGEEQTNFALLKLIRDSNATFLELQQAAHDLEYALYSIPELESQFKAMYRH